VGATLSDLSRLLGVSPFEANVFYSKVFGRFSQLAPSLQQVVDCLRGHPKMPRNPEIVAAVIRGDRSRANWSSHRRLPPPPCEENEIGVPELPDWDEPQWPSSIQHHDPRQFSKQLDRCAHGVLKTKKCAICNRRDFEMEYGLDG
jgi:hypothetical protein